MNRRILFQRVGLIIIVVIITVVSVGLFVLVRFSDSARQGETLASNLRLQANRLSILEWESISKLSVNHDLFEKMADVRNEFSQTMNSLTNLHFKFDKKPQLVAAWDTYNTWIDKELRFIEAGDMNQAKTVDEEYVDPAFENIYKILVNIELDLLSQGKKARKASILGAISLILGSGLLIGIMIRRDIVAMEVLRESEKKYRNIIENAVEGIFQTTPEGRYISVNPALVRMFRYDSPEDMMSSVVDIGRQLYVNPEQRKEYLRLLNEKGVVENYEAQRYRKDGSVFWVSINTRTVRDDAGNLLHYEGFITDITERKWAEQALRASEERYRSLASSVDSMYLVDRNYRYLFMNEQCRQRFGLPLEDLIGKRYNDFHSEENSKQFAKTVEEIFETGKPIQMEYQSEKDQSYLLRTFSPVMDQEGKSITAVTISSKDITDRKLAEEALRNSEKRYHELSIIDDLTKLYNSRHFYIQLKSETERSNRYGQPLTLLLLDLDDFKRFNDAYGHIEGDRVLSRFGQVFKRCLRQTDSAYRYGGEEFTILLPMTTRGDGVVIAERIRAEFKREGFSPVAGKDVHMTVSIGLAQYKSQEDMKAFVHRVDQLMYQAKKSGKDRVCSES